MKFIEILTIKKNRLTSKLTIIEGLRIIDEAINLNTEITQIYYVSKFFEKNKSLLTKIDLNGIPHDTIELKAELFSLDGSERYYVKSSKNISQANELGLEVGENLKRQSKGNYKK